MTRGRRGAAPRDYSVVEQLQRRVDSALYLDCHRHGRPSVVSTTAASAVGAALTPVKMMVLGTVASGKWGSLIGAIGNRVFGRQLVSFERL